MADSPKNLQLRELKDMIAQLNQMIKTLQATLEASNKREEQLARERDNLKEEVALLRKKLFGSSSEKRTCDIPGQMNLFNEAEDQQDPAAAIAEELEATTPVPEKKRRPRSTNAERFHGVPVTKEYLDIRISAKEGFAVAMENNIFTILDTTLTDELIDEGLARELISKVQQLRKQNDYEMMDNITIEVTADEAVKAAMAKHADYIRKETLAVSLESVDGLEAKYDLNGHKSGIKVERV